MRQRTTLLQSLQLHSLLLFNVSFYLFTGNLKSNYIDDGDDGDGGGCGGVCVFACVRACVDCVMCIGSA